MSLIHDIIKIKYSREGYLPNWPYHLISDSEMCDAFLNDDSYSYFYDHYPNVSSQLQPVYDSLVDGIKYHIQCLKSSLDDAYTLPDWVYAYMLGNVIGPSSTQQDIHDLLVMLGTDNIDDIFTPISASACYDVSRMWINKLPDNIKRNRPPTCFGEPHVIKSLRLQTSSTVSSYTTT